MNIISIGGADAVTIDGINWTLYVRDTFDCPADDPQEFFEIEMPDIRFGDWNRESGLKRSPLIASYHYNEIQAIGHVLLDALQQYGDQCPFAFNDNYELWLLDESTNEPLALLHSVCNENEIFLPEDLTWEAGLRCKQEFLIDDCETDTPAGQRLNDAINQRAGKKPAAQWFYRDQLNYGKGLNGVNLEDKLVQRELSARLFPKMLVQQEWQDTGHHSLINAFIEWLSPYLLVLDFLRDTQRKTLEQAARQQAILVDRMHILYPKIIDQQAINAARVEAMMRKSNQKKVKDDTADRIEYIETQHSLI